VIPDRKYEISLLEHMKFSAKMVKGNSVAAVDLYYFLNQNIFDANIMVIEPVPVVVTKY
jgi:hypothetical protein